MSRNPKLAWFKRFRRKVWKFSKFSFCTLLLVSLAAYGYIRYDFETKASGLYAEIATAQRIGIPTESSELERDPPVADSENAAPLYKKAHASFEALELKSDFMDALTGANREDKDDFQFACSVVKRLEPTLAIAQQAVNRPHLDDHLNFEEPWTLPTQSLVASKTLAKAFSLRSNVYARLGHVDQSIQDLKNMRRIAAHVAEESTMLYSLVSIAIDAMALRAAEVNATYFAKDAAALRKLRQALNSNPAKVDAMRVLRTEAFLHFQNCNRLEAAWESYQYDLMGSEHDVPRLVSSWRFFPPFIDADLVERANAAEALKFWNSILNSPEVKRGSSFEKGIYIDQSANSLWSSAKPWFGTLEWLIPYHSNYFEALDRHTANLRCTVAMLDILDFKHQNGRFPNSLREAGIKGQDPFSDNSIQYRIAANGFRVYSIGANRKDDGGQFQWEAPKSEGSHQDLITIYPYSDRHGPGGQTYELMYRRKIVASRGPGLPAAGR